MDRHNAENLRPFLGGITVVERARLQGVGDATKSSIWSTAPVLPAQNAHLLQDIRQTASLGNGLNNFLSSDNCAARSWRAEAVAPMATPQTLIPSNGSELFPVTNPAVEPSLTRAGPPPYTPLVKQDFPNGTTSQATHLLDRLRQQSDATNALTADLANAVTSLQHQLAHAHVCLQALSGDARRRAASERVRDLQLLPEPGPTYGAGPTPHLLALAGIQPSSLAEYVPLPLEAVEAFMAARMPAAALLLRWRDTARLELPGVGAHGWMHVATERLEQLVADAGPSGAFSLFVEGLPGTRRVAAYWGRYRFVDDGRDVALVEWLDLSERHKQRVVKGWTPGVDQRQLRAELDNGQRSLRAVYLHNVGFDRQVVSELVLAVYGTVMQLHPILG